MSRTGAPFKTAKLKLVLLCSEMQAWCRLPKVLCSANGKQRAGVAPQCHQAGHWQTEQRCERLQPLCPRGLSWTTTHLAPAVLQKRKDACAREAALVSEEEAGAEAR